MGRIGIGFDVYGTLVNPLEVSAPLRELVGDLNEQFAALWRQKQLEYSFRKGLMEKYESFRVCTRQALDYCDLFFETNLSEEQRENLMERYSQFSPYPEVIGAMQNLKRFVSKIVAFSNGPKEDLEKLLGNAGILPVLDDLVSVEEIETFKPNPKVYLHLAKRLALTPEHTWLVSSNPWDVIGAKSAGLNAAWIERKKTVFDPWGIQPDLTCSDLQELSERLEKTI